MSTEGPVRLPEERLMPLNRFSVATLVTSAIIFLLETLVTPVKHGVTVTSVRTTLYTDSPVFTTSLCFYKT